MKFHTKQGTVQALQGIDLQVERGEIFVLLGRSGSGKTTLLRCLAGLEKPDTGQISLAGKVVFSDCERIFVPPQERELGMVFQSYAIWPHLTVFENVALPLTQAKRKLSKQVVQDRVREALQLVQLEGLEKRPAPLLSGGQQQRVALARALAIKPQALLMDEPLSNLDARLREDVRSELRELVKKIGVTVLYVTHDQVEAMALADRTAMMDHGVILQVGHPQELYHQPVNVTVAEFFGSVNWLEGRITEAGVIKTEIGTLHADSASSVGSQVVIAIRPEDIQLSASPSGNANEFEGEIVSTTFLGDYSLYQVQTRTSKRILKKAMGSPIAPGKAYFQISKDRIRVFYNRELSSLSRKA
ncbi:MAG: ABC transporter ATP-binding protein [Candidatus Tectomicrobia bacterium]|uniref:ABC transporter ATP-binding protein n=1 Tax=Tectimicrobiota bacterium TaxID=2528274 RepID=A0A932GQS7_UNCTE|nr:ABC transporter ATP-binding protein [Candidatus Tectomicrobia bacterium]